MGRIKNHFHDEICAMADEPKVKMVCTKCGSDDVRCDAYAIWSIPNQQWELLTTFDNTDCENCGGECSLTSEPVEESD